MWKALQNGWEPPNFVSEKEWKEVRNKMDSKYSKNFIAFVRFGCSFGADWFGGYARNVRKDSPGAELLNRTTKSYCGQSKRNILKQLPKIQDVTFIHSHFENLTLSKKSLIYCDPPYEGTTKYADDFNHSRFWDWCREKVKENHIVFVSEYKAPKDFTCIWNQQLRNSLNNTTKSKQPIERLFIHSSQLKKVI